MMMRLKGRRRKRRSVSVRWWWWWRRSLLLVLAKDEGTVESVGFFKAGVSEGEVGHFGGLGVRGCVDDGEFDEGGVEAAELVRECECECECRKQNEIYI